MNLSIEMKILEKDKNILLERMNELSEKAIEAGKFTDKFLEICRKHKIKKVAIGVSHESIPESVGFPFGASGSVFASERDEDNRWPAIWKVVEEAGISSGAGNTGQHQISNQAILLDGTYHLKGNNWKKID